MIEDSKSKLGPEGKTGESPVSVPEITITPTRTGFTIGRKPCVVCGEPPFGTEYCCGHNQNGIALATTAMPVKASTRPLYEIAREIRLDWSKQGKDLAESYPYLYFLANASSWRGETAKRVKAELKALTGGSR